MTEVSVDGTEFIRMFLMHVLPKGFAKIRYCGAKLITYRVGTRYSLC